MADQPTAIPELFPDEEEFTPEEELAASDDAVLADDLDVVVDDAPPPIGRSWAFDFTTGTFVMAGHSPAVTTREQTLRYWIEKCLRTVQGSHPIHPPEYGLPHALTDYIGGTEANTDIGALAQDVHDALVFHPNIEDVEVDDATWGELGGDEAVVLPLTIYQHDGAPIDLQVPLASGDVIVA